MTCRPARTTSSWHPKPHPPVPQAPPLTAAHVFFLLKSMPGKQWCPLLRHKSKGQPWRQKWNPGGNGPLSPQVESGPAREDPRSHLLRIKYLFSVCFETRDSSMIQMGLKLSVFLPWPAEYSHQQAQVSKRTWKSHFLSPKLLYRLVIRDQVKTRLKE